MFVDWYCKNNVERDAEWKFKFMKSREEKI